MMAILGGTKACIGLFVLAAVYTGAVLIQPAGFFWSPDEGGKFMQMLNLHWQDGLRYAIDYPGRWLDPGLAFHSFPDLSMVRGNEIHFLWPLWFPLLTWPLYQLFGNYGLIIIPPLAGLGAAVMSGAIARRLELSSAPYVPFLVGLATPVFFYSSLFWEHTLAVLLALVAFYLLLAGCFHEGSRWKTFAAGAALGLSVCFREDTALLGGAIALGLVLCRPAKMRASLAVGLFLAGALVPLLPPALFYYATTGAITSPHVGDYTALGPSAYAVKAGLFFLVEIVAGSGDFAANGLFSASLVLGAACLVATGFLPGGRARDWLIVLGLAAVSAGAAVFVFSPERYRSIHGLLIAAPFVAMAASGLRSALLGKDPARRFAFTTTFIYVPLFGMAIGLFSARGLDSAGLEWGPRFVLSAFPLLAVLSLASLEYLRREMREAPALAMATACFLLLVGLSTALEVRGLMTLVEDKKSIAGMSRALDSFSQRQVVSGLWWLQFALVEQYGRKEFFYVENDGALYAWARLAHSGGITTFWYAGQGEYIPAPAVSGSGRPVLRQEEVRSGDGIVFTRLTILPSK